MKIPGLVKIRAMWDTLRTSYWFVPTLMAVTTAILWVGCYTIDLGLADSVIHRLGWIYTGGPDGAREMLAVVAGSMITIAGVTFSITIVALTLASQQFGPFLLRNFMRDTGNQIVLGTFISTFLFCLLTLRVIRGTDEEKFVPHLSVSVAVLLAIFSLGVLIYFIHHVSAFIQASNIISVVGRDLNAAVDRLFPDRLGSQGRSPRSPPATDDLGAACPTRYRRGPRDGPEAAGGRATRHSRRAPPMGKGDQRTEKGKRIRKTHGKSRPKGGGPKAKPAAPKSK